jgi:hypothetical protein
MRAFADKNIAFNFATSTSFQQYVSYISRDKFSALSRSDLVRSLEELCDVITTKVGRLLRESCFISKCADAWTSAGRHVTAITAGNPGLTIYMNSYENLGTDDAVSGAEAVAACILTSLGLGEGCDADSTAFPSKVAVLTSDTTAMMPAMAQQLQQMPLCKGLVWAPCFSHVANLLLQDQLHVPDIAQLLAHAKQIVLTFRSGGFRKMFILYAQSYRCLTFCNAKSDYAVHAHAQHFPTPKHSVYAECRAAAKLNCRCMVRLASRPSPS